MVTIRHENSEKIGKIWMKSISEGNVPQMFTLEYFIFSFGFTFTFDVEGEERVVGGKRVTGDERCQHQ